MSDSMADLQLRFPVRVNSADGEYLESRLLAGKVGAGVNRTVTIHIDMVRGSDGRWVEMAAQKLTVFADNVLCIAWHEEVE